MKTQKNLGIWMDHSAQIIHQRLNETKKFIPKKSVLLKVRSKIHSNLISINHQFSIK
jgi:hypothetical protein